LQTVCYRQADPIGQSRTVPTGSCIPGSVRAPLRSQKCSRKPDRRRTHRPRTHRPGRDPNLRRGGFVREVKRGARYLPSKAHVVQLAAHGALAGFDLAQALAIDQLCKGHGQILVAARKAPMVRIAAIALDILPENVIGGAPQTRASGNRPSRLQPTVQAAPAVPQEFSS
jgi:hypothetical protein